MAQQGIVVPMERASVARTATVERPWTAQSVPWNGCHKPLFCAGWLNCR